MIADWCEEKMACHEDPTKECEIKNWCVCQWAWEMYVQKQGCENIVDLHCESVNMKANGSAGLTAALLYNDFKCSFKSKAV